MNHLLGDNFSKKQAVRLLANGLLLNTPVSVPGSTHHGGSRFTIPFLRTDADAVLDHIECFFRYNILGNQLALHFIGAVADDSIRHIF